MAIKKILYQNKVGIVPKTIQINQVWDNDMNEIKDVVNSNSDQLTTNTQDIANLKNNPLSASNVSAVPSLVYLIGTNVQDQLNQTESNLIGLYKLDKTDEKSLKQTGRNRIDSDNSILSILDGDTLSITNVNDILFVNEILIDSSSNKTVDFIKNFGVVSFVADGTNTPLAANTRGIFYVGINKLGANVFRTSKVYDQDVCYLARILVNNTAGVYTIVSFKYMPDLANNRINNRDRLVIGSGNIVHSGAASISFGNKAVSFMKNSINYVNNHLDPNYLQVADSVNPTPMQFLFILPNVTSLAVDIASTTVLNPTQWYTSSGSVGVGAVANNNYQVYNVLLTVTGSILIQTKESTVNTPVAGVNAIFGTREEALAGLDTVVFPPILPAGDSIVLGTFYLRAGTAVNGSQMNLTTDFFFKPKTSSVSNSTVGVTSHDALSGKNDNPAFLHVTSTDIINWNGKANDNNVVHLTGVPETITSVKTFTTVPNAVVTNIDMPAVDNSPTGGVPDALVIKVRGHNGSSTNYTAAISVIGHSNRSAGFAFSNSTVDPDLTNGVAFYSRLKASSVGNLFTQFYKGDEVVSSIDDSGAAFFKGLIQSSLGLQITNNLTSPFIDLFGTTGFSSVMHEGVTNEFRIYNSSILGFVLDDNGNVCIGDSTPIEKLHVEGPIFCRIGNDSNGFYGKNRDKSEQLWFNAYVSPEGHGLLKVYDNLQVDKVFLNTSGNSYLNGGNVGIGTTSPTAKLTSKSSSNSPAFRILQDNNEGFGHSFWSDSSTGAFKISRYSSGADLSPDITIVSGNVGIGTPSPLEKLEVAGNLLVTGVNGVRITNGSEWNLNTDATTFNISETNIATRVTVQKTTGNVGIGTINPQQKLVVSNGTNGFEVFIDTDLAGIQSYNRSTSQFKELQYAASVHNFAVGSINVLAGSVTAAGGFFNSDARLKDIISRDGDVVTFKWKDGRDDKQHIGLIAQEVQEYMPDAIQEGADGMLSVNYIEVLLSKISQLEKRITELENK